MELMELRRTILARRTAQTMKRLEPEMRGVRAEYERQIADLRKKNDELTNCLVEEQQENADYIAEIAALKAKLAEKDAEAVAPGKPARRKSAK